MEEHLDETGWSDDRFAEEVKRAGGRSISRGQIQKIRTGKSRSTTYYDAILQALKISPEMVNEMDRLLLSYRTLRRLRPDVAAIRVQDMEDSARRAEDNMTKSPPH